MPEAFSQSGDSKLDDDPVLRILLSGRAKTAEEAEDLYLDESLPEVYRLLARGLPPDELMKHPLMQMLCYRGSRGWEDS
jgi:hypothetical protein